MTRLLYRTGRWAAAAPLARHRRLARSSPPLILGLAAGFGGDPQDDWNVPERRGPGGLDLLREHVPGAGNATARVVVHDEDGAVAGRGPRRRSAPGCRRCRTSRPCPPPRLSEDGDTALLLVGYDVEVTHPDLMGDLDAARGRRRPHP